MERSSEHPRPELDGLSIVMVAETLPAAPHPIGGAGKLPGKAGRGHRAASMSQVPSPMPVYQPATAL